MGDKVHITTQGYDLKGNKLDNTNMESYPLVLGSKLLVLAGSAFVRERRDPLPFCIRWTRKSNWKNFYVPLAPPSTEEL